MAVSQSCFSLEKLGIALVTLPLSCFCFATLYLTISNFQRSEPQHQTAECGSYHNFLESLKAETWKRRHQQRPRAGPTPPWEAQGWGTTDPWEKQLFFQAHAAPPMDKKTAFLWSIWEWQSLPPSLPQYRVRCRRSRRLERSGSSRAGGTLHPL